MNAQKCPRCERWCRNSTRVCDCGYEFKPGIDEEGPPAGPRSIGGAIGMAVVVTIVVTIIVVALLWAASDRLTCADLVVVSALYLLLHGIGWLVRDRGWS